MKTFNSWQEAYEYQLNSRTDNEDPLFMWDYDLESHVFSIDNVVATTGNNVVWLIVKETDCEHYTQFGVGNDLQWYSIKFDGYEKEITVVEGSFSKYQQLPHLVEKEKDAVLIYQNIEKLFEVFPFLTTGKINLDDPEQEIFKQNAQRMVQYAKNQLKNLGLVEEKQVEEKIEEDYLEEDLDLDLDLDLDEDNNEQEKEKEKDDTCCQECSNCTSTSDKYNESSDEKYEQLSFFEDEEEDIYTHIFHCGNEKDSSDDAIFYDECTKEEAVLRYAELIAMGFGFVTMSKVERVHMNLI